MIREIVEIGVVIGLAIAGVAFAAYQHTTRTEAVLPPPPPAIEYVVPVVPPPPPPPPIADEQEPQLSEDGETTLQAPVRSPQDIVIPLPRSVQAVDQIEQHLEQIQERLDRIEKKADEGKK